MRYSPQQADLILKETGNILQESAPADAKLDRLWWMLLFAHSACMMRNLKNQFGDGVLTGPFKGMRLTPAVLEANSVPHTLGCYEQELHPVIERAIAAKYEQIINIGCAFGYYSVGLALRMPSAKVYAFDIDEKEIARCRAMAALNNVADRVTVAGEFKGGDFASYAGKKTLALVDIEAAEVGLLEPESFPALYKMDVIVELHDCNNPNISSIVCKRFEKTHDIEIIRNQAFIFPFNKVFGEGYAANLLDSFVAAWEMRDGPTPWAYMRVKA